VFGNLKGNPKCLPCLIRAEYKLHAMLFVFLAQALLYVEIESIGKPP